MVVVGEEIRCPVCCGIAKIVWISKDFRTAGIRCPASHRQLSRPKSQLGSTARPESKCGRNLVFMIDI